MLAVENFKQLERLVHSSTKEELIWINGYLSGIITNGKFPNSEKIMESATITKKINIVYGTETGNSKKIATQFAAIAKKKGIQVKLTDLSQYKISDLEKEEYFFTIISTQGEGEPPIPAKKFYDYLHENEIVLTKMKFAVLALGDSSYPLFCKTGEDIDARFEKFGAKRFAALQKCDVDYEADALAWFDNILTLINEKEDIKISQEKTLTPIAAKKTNAKKYYDSIISANINLNDTGSNKQIYHIELSTNEIIDYEAGDAIGIVPQNSDIDVQKIISISGVDPNTIIETSKITASLSDLITTNLNIYYLLTNTVKKYATIVEQEIPDTRMDLLDLLRIYPVKNVEQFIEVIKILNPIAPRLYSISSSPVVQTNEVHITVERKKILGKEENKYGLCSNFLGDLPVNTTLNFYVYKNKSFKLPSADKDIIMIGPGTGIAPMRSFLIERDATGATGKNWLFFGDEYFTTDFLYQTEIQSYVSTDVITKLDLAFTEGEINGKYVHDAMLSNAKELYQWIDNGASIFISGEKEKMSKQVEETLLKIIENEGKITSEESKKYLEKMKSEHRYEKDVY
jgi:sulfite reductase (NADPH) flavoprotein alpha-component